MLVIRQDLSVALHAPKYEVIELEICQAVESINGSTNEIHTHRHIRMYAKDRKRDSLTESVYFRRELLQQFSLFDRDFC